MSGQQADFVVVANRLPVDLERGPDGEENWKRSPGGLVTALEPMLRGRGGAWVGWPGLADADAEPFEDDGLQLHPVRLSAEDVEDYYEGFSNATLWPLYHDVVAPPEFHRHWWRAYVRSTSGSPTAAAEVAAQGATVWVQDYQLQLVPAHAARAAAGPADRVLPAHPVPAHRAVRPAALARADRARACSARTWSASTPPAAPGTSAAWPRRLGRGEGREQHEVARTAAAAVKARRVPDLDRRRRARRAVAPPRGRGAGGGDPRRAGRPAQGGARRRPARLHQGHRRPPARVRGAARTTASSRDDTVLVQIATPSRERVEHYQPAAGRDRADGRADQRRPRQVGQPAVHYLHQSLPARGAGGVLPGRRRHAGHAAARRDEPRGQGVRRQPARRRWRAGAVGVHRRGPAS